MSIKYYRNSLVVVEDLYRKLEAIARHPVREHAFFAVHQPPRFGFQYDDKGGA